MKREGKEVRINFEEENKGTGCMGLGAFIAYQVVKEEIDTIIHELDRKGIEEPKGFSVLKAFVEDRMKELN